MIRKKKPEIINLPEGKLDEIKSRFEAGSILEEDKKIILLILSTYSWHYRQLQAKKLGIHRLRNLFGFSTEKRSRGKKKDDETTPPDLNGLPGEKITPIKKPPNGIQRKTMDD
jgi:hypothetical protein